MTETRSAEKALETMEAEVEQYCRDKGWYDTDVPFQTALALLHEEASEAGHAWRVHGLEDATGQQDLAVLGGTKDVSLAKPEGVGSELADVLIRLLDDSTRYGLDLPAKVKRCTKLFALSGDFLTEVNTLHNLISFASMTWEDNDDRYVDDLVEVHAFLVQMAGYYGVDLMAEYERKMQFNRTRPHRHGGRRA
jgi:NTP pyrophosphatase (non-canonical NTP hydrolase)